MEPHIYKTGQKKRIGWKRLVLWGAAGLLVVCLAAGGGFYLWFRAQVGAANERVDPGVVQALGERPSSTSASSPTSASTSTPNPGSLPEKRVGAAAVSGLVPASSTAGSTEAAPETPSGMNIVLLGSDKRASTGAGGRSDSIMLIHVDPAKSYLSVLSIPRDLYVTIPGRGPQRINAAYVYGGPALVIRTIQSTFGVDLDHYIEVDFNAFRAITDTLGGVYVDIDRTYDDGKIQFQPGYQLLDGSAALGYVRTRHDKNYDFGRMERQQRFISAVREQAMGWNLPLKLPGLIKALFDNIDTDLSANEVLKLAYWGVKMDGSRIHMGKLSGESQMIDGRAYVVIPPEKITAAVKAFLTAPPAASGDTTSTPDEDRLTPATLRAVDLKAMSIDVENATGRAGQGALAATWLLRQGAKIGTIKEADKPSAHGAVVTYPAGRADEAKRVASALGITMTRESSEGSRLRVVLGDTYRLAGDRMPEPQTQGSSGVAIPNADEWRALAAATELSLAAPTYLPTACAYSFRRGYSIKAGDESFPAVRVGYRYGSQDRYLGVSETSWLEAPLASPGVEVKGPGGTVYTLVGTRTKTSHIWWKSDGVLHWVSNTLYSDVRREEMLAAALTVVPVRTTAP